MTLIMIIILAAILIVFAIFAVKRASRRAGAVNTGSRPIQPTNTSAAQNKTGAATPVGPGDFMASTPTGSVESGRGGGVSGTSPAGTPGAAATGPAAGTIPPANPYSPTGDANVANPTGSVPDKSGTKGDGSAALSGGGQG